MIMTLDEFYDAVVKAQVWEGDFFEEVDRMIGGDIAQDVSFDYYDCSFELYCSKRPTITQELKDYVAGIGFNIWWIHWYDEEGKPVEQCGWEGSPKESHRLPRMDLSVARSKRELMCVRSEVQKFAIEMERRLKANDHKPGWKNDDPEDLWTRCDQELMELREAVQERRLGRSHKPILEEAVDVANMLMMVADVCDIEDSKK